MMQKLQQTNRNHNGKDNFDITYVKIRIIQKKGRQQMHSIETFGDTIHYPVSATPKPKIENCQSKKEIIISKKAAKYSWNFKMKLRSNVWNGMHAEKDRNENQEHKK